jgi:hypothetical protein
MSFFEKGLEQNCLKRRIVIKQVVPNIWQFCVCLQVESIDVKQKKNTPDGNTGRPLLTIASTLVFLA